MVKSSPEKLAKALRANLKKRKATQGDPAGEPAPENPRPAPESGVRPGPSKTPASAA